MDPARKDTLIEQLIAEGYLLTPRIIDAFRHIDRADFVAPDLRQDAPVNSPLPIGYGQTISQPLTVAFMLELLEPRVGDIILDVGSGSGWQTALLAWIVGKAGKVIAIERIRPLLEFGKANVQKYPLPNVAFIVGDGTRGYEEGAPYDKIIVGAGAKEIPQDLVDQLKVGGRLVIPHGEYEQDIVRMDKISKTEMTQKRFPGFQFVPLIPSEWGA